MNIMNNIQVGTLAGRKPYDSAAIICFKFFHVCFFVFGCLVYLGFLNGREVERDEEEDEGGE